WRRWPPAAVPATRSTPPPASASGPCPWPGTPSTTAESWSASGRWSARRWPGSSPRRRRSASNGSAWWRSAAPTAKVRCRGPIRPARGRTPSSPSTAAARPCWPRSWSTTSRCGSGTCTDWRAAPPPTVQRRAAVALLRQAELVVEVGQVELDRGLRDVELGGHLPDPGRRGEGRPFQQRAAQRHQQLPLPAGEDGRAVRHRGDFAVVAADGEERQAAVAEPEFVARPQPGLAPDRFAVDERAVGRAEVPHAEARGVALDHGVEPGHGRVEQDDDVVGRRPAERRAVVRELDQVGALRPPDFDESSQPHAFP